MSWFKRGTRGDQAARSKGPTRQPLVLALEPRVMFDGAAVATAAVGVHAAQSVHAADAHSAVAAKNLASAAVDHSSVVDKTATPAAVAAAAKSAGVTPGSTNGTEVLVVDSRIPDYQQVVNAANPGVKVVVLNLDQDGVQQIADAVSGMHDIKSISIVSHGDKGVVLLGDDALDNGDLNAYAPALKAIGNSLSPDGDILLYGCNVGSGAEGKAFLASLAAITGADVAASTDNTGGAALGGNWDLEIATGTIDSAPALNVAELTNYDHLLVTQSVSTVAQLKAAIATGDTDGVDDLITITGNLTYTSAADAISINVTDGHTMTIVGGGHTLDAGYFARGLSITAGTVEVDNLTIEHGLVSGAGADKGQPGGSALGAGISNAGTLTLVNVTVTNNYAAAGGGSLANGSYAGGGGGGGSGVGSIGGAAGGTTGAGAHTYTGQAGGSGSGGNGGSYNGTYMVGHGGTSAGGGAGGSGSGYANGGNGGTATVGAVTIGGGGGGSGWAYTGTTGGNAAGGIYNSGTLFVLGSSAVSSNAAAAGGGGGGGTGGAGGIAAGGIWNAATGKVYMAAVAYAAMTGNAAGGGYGGTARSGGGGTNGATGAASAKIYNDSGTLDTNYVVDTITSATYDASTGVLAVTGTNMTTGDTIDPSKLTVTGQGGASYTLTSSSVTASSATFFSITLNAADKLAVNGLLNKNGTSAVDATTFNLAAAASWDVTAGNHAMADLTGNGITVSNVTSPTITSATYDSSTHVLTVSGTGLVATVGPNNDITVSDLTLTGEGGTTYTLTSADVDVTSATSFSVTLNTTDRAQVETMFNLNGTQSVSGTAYNLSAADNWDSVINNADISVATAGVNVSNVPVPAITSATYDVNTGALVVTGTGFLSLGGLNNDIIANKLTFKGDGGATYTLTDTSNVDITSGTTFTLLLSATDKAGINAIVNKNGTSSSGGITYNLAAAQAWDAGDGGAADTDLTGNGITVSGVPVPAITSATYDVNSGALVVTGTNFLSLSAPNNDIVANKLTFKGDGGATYTLTDTSNVDITSGTSFTLMLSATDKAGINAIVNRNGTSSTDGTTYNLAAAQGWDAGDGGAADADLTSNGITVSNVPVPAISSATYDANTGALVVTGTGFLSLSGATNDIVANKFTFTGEGGSTYTLTDTSNVDITSGTRFTLNLSATDRAAVDQIINKNGTSSTGGTTYNVAAAEDWAAGADAAVVVADTTGNGITVSNVAVPAITSATYDASSGALVVTGTGFLSLSGATNDIVANKFTFTGEGGSTYTLTDTSNVDITSGTRFTLNLSATDRAAINQIVNKNGTSSTSGTTYNIAAAEDWAAGADAAVVVADTTGNGITVSNVAVPAITSATYDDNTGQLVVTGSGFLSLSGANNDIVADKLTFTGEGGTTYTLTDTSNVDITSETSFTLTLSATDKSGVSAIINRNGTSSTGGTTYNLAAAEDWAAGADAAVVVADTTGNGVTVSNVPVPAISSATYDANTGALVVTGTGFLSLSGATNDIVANKFTFTGEGGSTYTLTDTSNVDITSGTRFTLNLSATDRAAVDQIVNKNGTSSTSGTTYNVAAAEDWAAGADAAVVVADTTGNGITVSNVAVPTITSATYDASTGALVVTGAGFLSLNGASNDIVASKLTFTGEGGSTYTLTDTSNVDITSGNSFTLNLSATDRAAINQIVNKNGTSSTSGTTYNIAAAEDWAAGADAAVVVADTTGNGITVSNVAVPTITSATYDASSGALVVTGTGFLSLNGATNDIVASKLTFTGEGGSTYTLTDTSNVDITSGTRFTLNLSATDRAAINQIVNKNGTSSTSGTTYNIAAAEDWAAGADAAVVVADTTGNGITVSNVAVPTITSATYDASTGALVVTGTGFLSLSGATNDIVANKLTFTGEGGSTYTLTDTSNVDITSGTRFILNLSATDRAAVDLIINKNGTSSTGGTTYNVVAGEDWAAGADAAVVVADTTGNGITVSNVAVPAITSATYDDNTGQLVVTGSGFLSLNGANNDIVADKLTFTGEGGTTYTLTDTSNVDITSETSFTLTLSATDKSGVSAIINRNGTSSTGGTTYNLAAAEDWAAGADAAVVVADTTGNGVTVSNVPVPTVTSATYDASTGSLVVTGTGFLSLSGAANDVVANKFTVTGDAGATYTLTDTSNVDIGSATSFTLTLSATDKAGVDLILNKSGTSSVGGTTYNLAAAEDWNAGADSAVVLADTTGNGITVSGGNTAPTLIDQSPTFGTIPNTQTGIPSGTAGTLVSQIINTAGISNFSDPDSGAQVGLAITATDTSKGAWWYTTDSGAHWADVSAVSNTSALLLKADANTRLYFQLAAGNTGSADITFRAWDQTSGTAGTKVDTSINGGSTAFSTATDTADANINVGPTVANLNGDSVTFTEGGSVALIDAGGNATVTDTDSPDFGGGNVTVSIVSNRVSTEDVLSIVNQGTGSGQIGVSGSNVTYEGNVIGTFSGGSGTNDLVISLNGLATPAAAQALVRDVAYSDSNSTDPSVAARSIRVTVDDGDGGTSSNADVTATVIGVNDAPTLSATGGARTFTENGSAVTAFSGVNIDTVEAGQSIKTITFSVSNVADGSNEIVNIDGSDIALTNGNSVTTATNGLTVDVQFAGDTATVTVASAGGISTSAAATVLDGLTYQNASHAPTAGSRVVTLMSIQDSGGTANGGVDTASLSVASTVTVVPVNDAPVMNASSGTTAFVEADNAASTPVAVDTGITVSDVDNATLARATVSVTGNFHSGEDVLGFTNTSSATYGNIGSSYDASNGVLTLTSAGGTATVAQWQSALRAVTYSDTSENPSTDARTVSFSVNDGTDSSAAVTKTVSVAAVNEAPVNEVPGPQTLSEGGSLVFSAGNSNQITISDVDAGGNPVEVTLTATNGTISLSSLSGLTFNAGTGAGEATMTFRGTMVDINRALDGLVYTPASGFSGSASLEIVTDDLGNSGGGARSDTDSIALTVNRSAVSPVILISPPSNTDNASLAAAASNVEPVVLAPRASAPLRVSSVASFDASMAVDRPLVPSTVVPSGLSYNVGLSAGGSFDVPLPQWLNIDFGSWAVFELRGVDGSAAPEWLHFDAVSGTLRGTPPAGVHGSLQLELIVTDGHGMHVSGAVHLNFDSHPTDPAAPAKPTAYDAPAKPSLESQFSQHARGTPLSAHAARALHLLQGRPTRATSSPSLAAAAASLRQGNLQ